MQQVQVMDSYSKKINPTSRPVPIFYHAVQFVKITWTGLFASSFCSEWPVHNRKCCAYKYILEHAPKCASFRNRRRTFKWHQSYSSKPIRKKKQQRRKTRKILKLYSLSAAAIGASWEVRHAVAVSLGPWHQWSSMRKYPVETTLCWKLRGNNK